MLLLKGHGFQGLTRFAWGFGEEKVRSFTVTTPSLGATTTTTKGASK